MDAEGSPEVWGPTPLQSGRKRWFHKDGLGNHWAVTRPVGRCVWMLPWQPNPLLKVLPGIPGKNPAPPPGRPWNDALWPIGYQRIHVLY